MKYLLAIGCLCLLVTASRAKHNVNPLEALKEHIEACAEEQKIMDSELPKFNDPNLDGDDKKTFGCLKLCVMKRLEVVDGTEVKLDEYENVLKKLLDNDADKVAAHMEIAKTCIETVQDIGEECEFAYEFSRCLMIKDDE